jgi:hypothetical protein
MIFDYSVEYTWPQFKNLEGVKKLPLQEQIKHYNKYLADLSIQRSIIAETISQNTFQSFQGSSAAGAGSGGDPVTSSYYPFFFLFAATSASACYSSSAALAAGVYYVPSASLQLGHILYTNSNLFVNATASAGFYAYNNQWFRVTGSGVIAASGSCNNISTPFGLSYDSNYIAGTASACTSHSAFPGVNTNYYLDYGAGCTSLNLGCALYTDASLTTFASSGSYSDGTKWYRVSGSGVIRFSGSCA